MPSARRGSRRASTRSCGGGWEDCNDDLLTDGCESDVGKDTANCGACAKACSVGQICAAGLCATQCATGQTLCAGGCVDTQTDDMMNKADAMESENDEADEMSDAEAAVSSAQIYASENGNGDITIDVSDKATSASSNGTPASLSWS